MERSIKQQWIFPSIPDGCGHPLPHLAQSKVYDHSNGRISVQRSSIDTPLSLYTASRTKFRLELDKYMPHSSNRSLKKSKTAPVPLCALCPPEAVPGAVGGSFNSTTKVKCLPLPAIPNTHQVSSRGVRKVGLHSDRYLPTHNQQRRRTLSESMLNLSMVHNPQRDHLRQSENNVATSRSLQRKRATLPHRADQTYYMSGHPAQLFDRQDIPQSELEVLQKVALSQNKHLFYGKGIKSYADRANKAVQQFDRKLQDTICALQSSFTYSRPESEMEIDFGRYSRTVTPGSPIIEEGREGPSPNAPTSRTFITDTIHS